MMRYLLVTLLLFVPMGMYSQMAIHSNLFIGADYEVYDAFDITSFHSGVVTIDRNGGIFPLHPILEKIQFALIASTSFVSFEN